MVWTTVDAGNVTNDSTVSTSASHQIDGRDWGTRNSLVIVTLAISVLVWTGAEKATVTPGLVKTEVTVSVGVATPTEGS